MTKKAKPLTREELLEMIEEHGGPEGLDLKAANMARIDLALDAEGAPLEFDLHGAFLQSANLQGAYLSRANLQGANLSFSNLQGADLWGANLQGADLWGAELQRCNLASAKLAKAKLCRAEISDETRLEDVHWGPMSIFREKFILGEEEAKQFEDARQVYRVLKQWHTDHGLYDKAGRFYYREMEATRKSRSWTRDHVRKLWSELLRFLCGYGEKFERVVLWGFVVIFGLAGFYTWLGSFAPKTFWDCLYYSIASFTALGYGSWAPQPMGWAKYMGAVEALIGVFLIALLLVTVVRRMTR